MAQAGGCRWMLVMDGTAQQSRVTRLAVTYINTDSGITMYFDQNYILWSIHMDMSKS